MTTDGMATQPEARGSVMDRDRHLHDEGGYL